MPRVLSAATKDNVGVSWEWHAWLVSDNIYVDVAPLTAFFESEDVAVIAIKIHFIGVEVENVEIHEMLLPVRILRMVSMAV